MYELYVVGLHVLLMTNCLSDTHAASYTVTLTSDSRSDSGTESPLRIQLCDYMDKCLSKTVIDTSNQFEGKYTTTLLGNLNAIDHAIIACDKAGKADGYDLVKVEVVTKQTTLVANVDLIVYDIPHEINLRKCPKRGANWYYGQTTDDCNPCNCDKNAKCNPYNGKCGTCATGFKGADCQESCDDGMHGLLCAGRCSPNCKNVCEKSNGDCDCKPGYYGSKCEISCESGRYGDYCNMACGKCEDTCSNTNGICIGSCIPGYIGVKCDECKGHRYGEDCLSCDNGTFGEICENNCSKHCVNVCDKRNGSCTCSPGYRPSNCFKRCPFSQFGFNCQDKCYTCSKGCDHVDGTCIGGYCLTGYIGHKCKPCNGSRFGVNCLHDCNCFKNYACNYTTGNCGRYGCAAGWTGYPTCSIRTCGKHSWGQNCIECGACRTNCGVNVQTCHQKCDRDSGVCGVEGCMPNFYGKRCDICNENMYGRKCDHYCGKCVHACDTVTGLCLYHKCQPGYVGTKCDIRCKHEVYGISSSRKFDTCQNETYRNFGHVLDFCNERNYFGPNCDIRCLNCEDDICTKNGKCIKGCIYGYWGEACRKPCISGMYGRNCVKFCGRCADWAECDKTTGDCAEGCLGQFVSPRCTVCPVEYFGRECNHRCGHCKDYEPCDAYIGVCRKGCAIGFSGHFCDITDVYVELDPALDL